MIDFYLGFQNPEQTPRKTLAREKEVIINPSEPPLRAVRRGKRGDRL
jgi:hypothetical protein